MTNNLNIIDNSPFFLLSSTTCFISPRSGRASIYPLDTPLPIGRPPLRPTPDAILSSIVPRYDKKGISRERNEGNKA